MVVVGTPTSTVSGTALLPLLGETSPLVVDVMKVVAERTGDHVPKNVSWYRTKKVWNLRFVKTSEVHALVNPDETVEVIFCHLDVHDDVGGKAVCFEDEGG